MRIALIALAFVIIIYAVTSTIYNASKVTYGFAVVNKCGADDYYVSKVVSSVKMTFDKYREIFGVEPPLYGPIVLTNDMNPSYAAYVQIQCGATGCYASQMVFRCDLSDVELTAFHESAHVLQAKFISPTTPYGWWIESSAEALAVYALKRPSWIYYLYFQGQYWTKSPVKLGDWSIDYYAYAMPIVWLMYEFSPEVFITFSTANSEMYDYYAYFLLSPWSWDKYMPASKPDFESWCGDNNAREPLTGTYCLRGIMLSDDEGLAVSSDAMVNATYTDGTLYIALTDLSRYTPSFTVTVIPPSTVTTTVTTTVTETVTETVTTTATNTVTTYNTVTVTETKLITTTQTVTVTREKNYTVTETVIKRETDYNTLIVLLAVSLAMMYAAYMLGASRNRA